MFLLLITPVYVLVKSEIQRNNEVLPLPFEPTKPIILSEGISRLILLSTTLLPSFKLRLTIFKF